MKKLLVVITPIAVLVVLSILFGFSHRTKNTTAAVSPAKGFAVVELFTSEGCSSCPAADEAVADLAKKYASNVYVLGFHVDYWNNLGWKDAFSSADYTNRQQAYATALALNSIYTPQVVVNGKTEFIGSEKNLLYATVEKELSNGSNNEVSIEAAASGTGNVQVTYKTNAGNESMVHVALVQLQASSAVQRGENKGRLLHHVDVVRNFKTVAGGSGSVSLALPAGVLPGACKVVAFIQHKKDLHITGAGECLVTNMTNVKM